jgi:hypothetical protein
MIDVRREGNGLAPPLDDPADARLKLAALQRVMHLTHQTDLPKCQHDGRGAQEMVAIQHPGNTTNLRTKAKGTVSLVTSSRASAALSQPVVRDRIVCH